MAETENMTLFTDFLNDKNNDNLIVTMRWCLGDFERAYKDMSLSFLHVIGSNATAFNSFSNAQIDLKFLKNQRGMTAIVPLGVFYIKGLYVLKEFLNETDPKIPEDALIRESLRDLLQFLVSDHTIFAEARDRKDNEWQRAIRFAQHLMIPLVPRKLFVMDHFPDQNIKDNCLLEHPANGEKGDTSFGCAEGWHGKADILIMGTDVPFSVIGEGDDDSVHSGSSNVHSDSSNEVKRDFTPSLFQQLMAQTIVFSFLKRKQCEGSTSNNLVPGIGICGEKILIYMNDCMEDILLEGMLLDLYDTEHGIRVLNVKTVVTLWLVLNYKLFGNTTLDKYKHYKSEFHKVLGEKYLKMYLNDVVQPCHVKPTDHREHVPYTSGSFFEESLSPFYNDYAVKCVSLKSAK